MSDMVKSYKVSDPFPDGMRLTEIRDGVIEAKVTDDELAQTLEEKMVNREKVEVLGEPRRFHLRPEADVSRVRTVTETPWWAQWLPPFAREWVSTTRTVDAGVRYHAEFQFNETTEEIVDALRNDQGQ